MFKLPFSIPNQKRDNNGNIICYVRANSSIEYVKSIENFIINFKGRNNTIIIYESNVKHKLIYIKMINNNILILKKTKYSLNNISISFKDNSKCYIGENCSFVDAHLDLREGKYIYIGNDCQVSFGVYIWNSDAHAILDKEGNPINNANDVYIGNHVWLGQNCLVLKGSYINDNSIVGAMSLVNKKFFEKNIVIAGNPAKIIKFDIGGWSRSSPSTIKKMGILKDY